MQIPLIGRGVQGRSRRLSPAVLVNVFPETHEGKLSDASLSGTGGLQQFADLGDRIRMMHEVGDTLYALAGDTLYEVDSNGNATAHGTVPGIIDPKADDNGLQIAIPVSDGYVFDINAETVSQITDPDYQASSSAAFISQYVSFIENGSGRFFISEFLDVTDFDSLNIATGESDPDVAVANHQFQGNHWLLNTKTCEVWYYSGEAFPLNPYSNGKYNVGCGARLSVASNEDFIVWVTNNRRVYASTGGKPMPISSPEVEYALSQLETVSDGVGFIFTEEGHTFYQVSFADLTLCYDFTTQWWFERRSGDTGEGQDGRHLAQHHTYVYGKNLVSDYRNGKIYHMSLDYGSDAGVPIVRQGILPPLFIGDREPIHTLKLTSETGITPINEPEAQFELRYSPEGGDWSNWMPQGLGREGQTLRRLEWHGLPSMQSMYFHWRCSVDSPFRLIRADV
jgi:hypothetical protein